MPSAPASLVRGLRRWDLVALVINSVVGAGIFGLPAQVYRLAGTFSLAAYGAAAFAIALIVICFAEVGSRFGATGGPYLYARAAFGRVTGFEVAWLMWVARIAGFASLINLLVSYVAFFAPIASTNAGRAVLIIAVVFTLALVNVIGLRATATVTNLLTAGKLIPLILLAVFGAFHLDPRAYAGGSTPSYAAFSQASLLLLFAYMGFEGAVIPTGEMRNPRRDVPFALFVGMGTITVLYVAVQAVCIGTVPDLAASSRPLADAAQRTLGAGGATLVAAAAIVSIGGILNAILFATPRLIFAMADNGDLPAAFARTHPRFRTPALAIVFTAAAALIVALFSTFLSALTISTIVRLLAYSVTCAAVPVMRRSPGMPPASFTAPAGVVVSAAAIALSLWLVSTSTWSEMRLAAVFVLAGIALFYASARRTVGEPAWISD